MQFKKLPRKIINRIRRPVFYKGLKKYDLIIFDDYFPNPITGFRLAEFNELLRQFNSIKIIIYPTGYIHSGLKKRLFFFHLKNYVKENFAFKKKIFRIRKVNNINCRLFYFVFLNNGRQIFHHLKKNKINFVFTLYPGGGFKMNEKNSDNDLKEIMSSEYFKGVIVNQECTKEYILKKKFCSSEKIYCITGLPISENKLEFNAGERKYYPEGKHAIDVCFMAAKYSQTGIDKGYDLFIEAAKILRDNYQNIRFHIIGGFTKDDIDVKELKEAIQFYGFIDAIQLPFTLQQFDIFISPNRPGMLGEGSFDGFPLGTCVEASLMGCVTIATDELAQNKNYIEEKEIIIIKPEVNDIVDKMRQLFDVPEKIQKIGVAGMKKTQELYSYKNQLAPRITLLKNIIG